VDATKSNAKIKDRRGHGLAIGRHPEDESRAVITPCGDLAESQTRLRGGNADSGVPEDRALARGIPSRIVATIGLGRSNVTPVIVDRRSVVTSRGRAGGSFPQIKTQSAQNK